MEIVNTETIPGATIVEVKEQNGDFGNQTWYHHIFNKLPVC